MKKIFSTKYQENSWSFALLILRAGFGLLMLKHGMDKLTDFNNYKGMNQLFGAPMDAILLIFAEAFCSIFLLLGLFTRFALIPLIIAMVVAFFKGHQGIIFGKEGGETALLYLIAFVCLLFTGPGKFSVDRMIAK